MGVVIVQIVGVVTINKGDIAINKNIQSYLETAIALARKVQQPKNNIKLNRELNVHSPHYISIEDFVLQHGNWYEPIASKKIFPRGREKQCLKNATQLVLNHKGFRYVEGFAQAFEGLTVYHAWCIDDLNHIVEPTWDSLGTGYLGICFNIEFLKATILRRGKYGIIDNYEEKFPLLQKPYIK